MVVLLVHKYLGVKLCRHSTPPPQEDGVRKEMLGL